MKLAWSSSSFFFDDSQLYLPVFVNNKLSFLQLQNFERENMVQLTPLASCVTLTSRVIHFHDDTVLFIWGLTPQSDIGHWIAQQNYFLTGMNNDVFNIKLMYDSAKSRVIFTPYLKIRKINLAWTLVSDQDNSNEILKDNNYWTWYGLLMFVRRKVIGFLQYKIWLQLLFPGWSYSHPHPSNGLVKQLKLCTWEKQIRPWSTKFKQSYGCGRWLKKSEQSVCSLFEAQ